MNSGNDYGKSICLQDKRSKIFKFCMHTTYSNKGGLNFVLIFVQETLQQLLDSCNATTIAPC